MTQNQKDVESLTNEFGAKLKEIRQTSRRLDRLLSTNDSLEYNSAAAADMATATLLLYWRFDESETVEILETYRARRYDNNHFENIVQRTTHTKIRPIDSALGKALIQSAIENDGRPIAGVITLFEIQTAFHLLGTSLTVTQILDSDIISWGNAKKESVRKRINRGLYLLEQAGYVSSSRVGRTIVCEDNGVTSLYLPVYDQSQSSLTSSIDSNAVSNVGNQHI